MNRPLPRFAATAAALLISLGSVGTLAQKPGGVLKMPDFASPASMSIHEEITRAAINALMPVFNNLVLFDQHQSGAGQSDPGREDGVLGSAHRRDRSRDQEPAQLRKQLR